MTAFLTPRQVQLAALCISRLGSGQNANIYDCAAEIGADAQDIEAAGRAIERALNRMRAIVRGGAEAEVRDPEAARITKPWRDAMARKLGIVQDDAGRVLLS